MSRYFFALDIAAKDKEKIAIWQQKLSLPFKPVAQDNFHITLAFLGNISDYEKSQLCITAEKQLAMCSQEKPFMLKLDKLGHFKKARVLYLSMIDFPDKLTQLANNLSASAINLDLFQENRNYHPHLTLFRKAKAIPKTSPDIDIIIKINSFSLYESKSTPTGVKYQKIKSWSLNSNN